jgi:CheY-like chemotaxis protein
MHTQVLVVEDDKAIREVMRDALELLGFTTSLAANGQEALDYIRAHGNPRLILLDLMMPVMDGWEFYTRLKQTEGSAKIPVVVISADGNAERKAENLGVTRGLKKPIDFDDLRVVAEEFCA